MKLIILITILCLASVSQAQQNKSTKFAKDQPEKNIINNEKPIVFINDEEVNYDYLEKFDKKLIDSLFVIDVKKSIEIYGEKGKNGTIIITTKKSE